MNQTVVCCQEPKTTQCQTTLLIISRKAQLFSAIIPRTTFVTTRMPEFADVILNSSMSRSDDGGVKSGVGSVFDSFDASGASPMERRFMPTGASEIRMRNGAHGTGALRLCRPPAHQRGHDTNRKCRAQVGSLLTLLRDCRCSAMGRPARYAADEATPAIKGSTTRRL